VGTVSGLLAPSAAPTILGRWGLLST
jgi:hypothetical protein